MPALATPPAANFLGTLRPFQQEGLAFLLAHDRCLLADEMGLGKTVQALAYLASQRELARADHSTGAPDAQLAGGDRCAFCGWRAACPGYMWSMGLKPYDLPQADVYILSLPAAARLEGDRCPGWASAR